MTKNLKFNRGPRQACEICGLLFGPYFMTEFQYIVDIHRQTIGDVGKVYRKKKTKTITEVD